MPNKNHVHTYALYKKRSGKAVADKVFKCMHPECTHYAEYERVVGKKSCCNNCGAEFILDWEALQRVYPRCLNCTNSKKGRAAQTAEQIMKALSVIDDYSEDNHGD